jgi:hypothetical protein
MEQYQTFYVILAIIMSLTTNFLACCFGHSVSEWAELHEQAKTGAKVDRSKLIRANNSALAYLVLGLLLDTLTVALFLTLIYS